MVANVAQLKHSNNKYYVLTFRYIYIYIYMKVQYVYKTPLND